MIRRPRRRGASIGLSSARRSRVRGGIRSSLTAPIYRSAASQGRRPVRRPQAAHDVPARHVGAGWPWSRAGRRITAWARCWPTSIDSSQPGHIVRGQASFGRVDIPVQVEQYTEPSASRVRPG